METGLDPSSASHRWMFVMHVMCFALEIYFKVRETYLLCILGWGIFC